MAIFKATGKIGIRLRKESDPKSVDKKTVEKELRKLHRIMKAVKAYAESLGAEATLPSEYGFWRDDEEEKRDKAARLWLNVPSPLQKKLRIFLNGKRIARTQLPKGVNPWELGCATYEIACEPGDRLSFACDGEGWVTEDAAGRSRRVLSTSKRLEFRVPEDAEGVADMWACDDKSFGLHVWKFISRESQSAGWAERAEYEAPTQCLFCLDSFTPKGAVSVEVNGEKAEWLGGYVPCAPEDEIAVRLDGAEGYVIRRTKERVSKEKAFVFKVPKDASGLGVADVGLVEPRWSNYDRPMAFLTPYMSKGWCKEIKPR